MNTLRQKALSAYRQRTFRLMPALRLTDKAEALDFVEERGFIYFWPIKDIILPSLWAAVAGDRPVASEHGDPGHVTWGWKDQMLDQRRWYYAKILRGRATIISLGVAPWFYALSENYGEPDLDYLDQYNDGLLSQPAKLIYEALLHEGPLDTVNLRKLIRMTSRASNSPFERGLVELQRDLKILPVGVANTGAWRYSFIYDLVHRYYPDIPESARSITRKTAQEELVALYFDSVGAATLSQVRLLFQWRTKVVSAVVGRLLELDRLVPGYRMEGSTEEFFITPKLLAG